jgi:hypothetical protein
VASLTSRLLTRLSYLSFPAKLWQRFSILGDSYWSPLDISAVSL